MDVVPLFCRRCGNVWPSGLYAMFGASEFGTPYLGNAEACPNCGLEAGLPDGIYVYSVVDDTVEVLSNEPFTQERLERLRAILESAQAGRISDEEAVEEIVREVPAWKPLFDRTLPHAGRAFLRLLLVILTIAAQQGLAEYRDHSATKDDVSELRREIVRDEQETRHLVQAAIDRCMTTPPPPPPHHPRGISPN